MRFVAAGFGCLHRLLVAMSIAVGLIFLRAAGAAFAQDASATSTGPAESAVAAGQEALRRGGLAEAATRFADAAEIYRASGRSRQEGAALLHLGEVQQALGRYADCVASLRRALELATANADDRQRAAALGALGNAYVATALPLEGRRPDEKDRPTPEDARRHLEEGAALARQVGAPEIATPILVNLGNHLAFSGEPTAALARHQEAAALARTAGLPRLEATALANAGRVALGEPGNSTQSRNLLDAALSAVRKLEDSHEKAYLLVNLGRSYELLAAAQPGEKRGLLLRSYEVLTSAAETAGRVGDHRAVSHAWGDLGGLYEAEGRNAEALELTQRGLAAAQQIDAPELIYQWQWQAGRLLAAQGELESAVEAYGAAVETLQGIRHELSIGYGARDAFQDVLRPVYYGRVDLLLQAARRAPDPARRQKRLEEARETVELLKADELRDYFRDECVLQIHQTKVDELPAVVVYPMILEDRVDLIVSIGGRLEHYTVPVGAAELGREVRTLRRFLEKRTTYEFVGPARKLYDWLVRPYEKELAASGLDTLVIVPDGPLRTIPFAALHDGKGFLIARYAVAITPGLALIEPKPLERPQLKVLLGGLSQAEGPFGRLPHVSKELSSVAGLYPSEVILDEQFRQARLVQGLEDRSFNILHIASHGQFKANFEDTFVQLYQDQLTMDELEDAVGRFRFRDKPLELLTLSACETAAGDDRAALGLAGVAVKAGARSVLATLWAVKDVAAAELVTEFYTKLKDPSVTRAEALQSAQLALLNNPAYEHPALWSAFVLISNWL